MCGTQTSMKTDAPNICTAIFEIAHNGKRNESAVEVSRGCGTLPSRSAYNEGYERPHGSLAQASQDITECDIPSVEQRKSTAVRS